MANGTKRNDDPFTRLLSNPGHDAFIPMTLEPAVADRTRVIDLTGRSKNNGSKRNGNGFLRRTLDSTVGRIGHGAGRLGAGSGELMHALGMDRPNAVPANGTPATRGPDMGVGPGGIPNSLRRRPMNNNADPVAETLRGYERPASFDNTNVAAKNLGTNPQDIASDFAGRTISDLTPKGVPEPSEISGLGKALSSFGKALETPGFQRFLSEMGIAFSGGRPNAPGTILGQQNIQALDADAEMEVMQRLLAGESLEDIDLSKMRNVESVRAATNVAQGQQQLKQRQDEQAFDENFQTERLRQFDEQLGIQRDRLDLDRLKLISDASNVKPDGVSSFEHGYALDTVATTDVFHNAAMAQLQSRAEELGLSTIADFQAVLRGEDGQLDPMAVRANLPAELQGEFDRQVNQLSQSVSRSFRNIDSPADLDFRPGLAAPSSLEEAQELSVGSMFTLPDGGVAVKTENGFRRITSQSVEE